MVQDKKRRILNELRRQQPLAKSKIAFLIRSDQWITDKYLEELEKEGKIVKNATPSATYWRLK